MKTEKQKPELQLLVAELKGENGGFATLVFATILLSNTRRRVRL